MKPDSAFAATFAHVACAPGCGEWSGHAAAEAMTTQGRRPRLVRWNWQRDVTHRFLYREQRMRFFADGVVALCIRTQQG